MEVKETKTEKEEEKRQRSLLSAIPSMFLILIVALLILSGFASAVSFQDTNTFGMALNLPPEAISFVSSSYGGSKQIDSVILRTGGALQGFRTGSKSALWSWSGISVQQGKSRYSADAFDFNSDGSLSEVVYIKGVKSLAARNAITQRPGDSELWSYSFDASVYAISACDFDGDGFKNDILVSLVKDEGGSKIRTVEAIKPSGSGDIILFKTFNLGFDAYLIAPASFEEDGKENDFFAATWVAGATGEEPVRDAKIYAVMDNGNIKWVFTPTDAKRKIRLLEAFDADSDGKEDEVIAIFEDPQTSLSDLYVISSEGEIIFSSPNTLFADKADFDGDGKKDDFVMVTKETAVPVKGGDSLEIISPNVIDRTELNSSTEKRSPQEFIAVSSLKLSGKRFNDIAILASMGESQGEELGIIFFVENIAEEEAPPETTSPPTTPPPTTPPPTTPPPTTPPPNKAPVIILTPSSANEGKVTIGEGASIVISAENSYDEDGSIASFEWSLDNEIISSEESVELKNLGAGEHELIVKLQDDKGAIAEKKVSITVKKGNTAPFAEIKYLPEKEIYITGESILLSANESYDEDGSIVKYKWYDNEKLISEEKEVNITLSSGKHRILLEVEDNAGAKGNASISIIANSPPVANAGEDMTVEEGNIILLSAEGSSDKDGKIVSYEWYYNNELIGKGEKINISALSPGEYEIVLKVKDNLGFTGEDSVRIIVKEKPGFFEVYNREIKSIILTLLGILFTVAVFIVSRRMETLF